MPKGDLCLYCGEVQPYDYIENGVIKCTNPKCRKEMKAKKKNPTIHLIGFDKMGRSKHGRT